MKAIKTKHIKDGIMRRNKLLLEHILNERLEKSISTIYYYRGLDLDSPTSNFDRSIFHIDGQIDHNSSCQSNYGSYGNYGRS